MLLRRQDIVIGLALILICAVWFVWRSQGDSTHSIAQIYLDGTPIDTIVLKEADDYRIDLMPAYGVPVSFLVQNGAISFTEVTCPDHICERTGFISRVGQTATCLPNRVAVHILPPN